MKQLSFKEPLTKIFIIILCITVGTIIISKKFIMKPCREEVAKRTTRLEHIRLEDEIAKIQNEINACEKSLPPQKEPSWLLTQITLLAEQSKINIESMESLPLKQIPPYSYVPLKIHTICTYSQLAKFMQLIESSPYILNIESLELESKGTYIPGAPNEELAKEVLASVKIVVGTIY